MRPTDDGMSSTTIRRSPRAPPTGRTHAKTRARATPDPTRNRNRNQTRIRPGDPTKRTGRDARPPTRACAAPGSGSSPDCSRACPASSANPGAPADRGRHARRPAHAADENEKKETKKRKKRKRAKEENTIRHHPISHRKRKKTGHRHPGTHATDTTPRRKPHHKTASHQGEGSFFLAKNRVSGAHSRPP